MPASQKPRCGAACGFDTLRLAMPIARRTKNQIPRSALREFSGIRSRRPRLLAHTHAPPHSSRWARSPEFHKEPEKYKHAAPEKSPRIRALAQSSSNADWPWPRGLAARSARFFLSRPAEHGWRKGARPAKIQERRKGWLAETPARCRDPQCG